MAVNIDVARRFRWLWTPPKPRIVLALLVLASLTGRWLTAQTRAAGFLSLLGGWLVLLGVAVVVAAVTWRLTLFQRFAPSGPSATFADRRFDLLALAGTGALVAGASLAVVLDPTAAAATRLVGGLLAAGGVVAGIRYDSRVGYGVAVVLGVIAIAATAVEHVHGVEIVPTVVRFAHLGAVAVWFGGALWHNVILAPTIQRFPDAKPAFKAQAKRFRPAVLASITVIILTGFYQSCALLGTDVGPYLTTSFGNAILLKLGVIGALAALVVVSMLRR
jgi:hypothetical protein